MVTTVSQSATVNRSLSDITADIYNSAGELVRTLYSSVSDATGSTMNSVLLSTNYIRPSESSPAASGAPPVVHIVIQSSGSPVTVSWDGTNNSATDVTPGVYTIDVHWSNGDVTSETIVRQIMVLAGAGGGGLAVARPNVLNASNGMTTNFDASTVPNAASLQVQIYTITGELIRVLNSSNGTPQVNWNGTGMASGIYIAALTLQNADGGTLAVQRLKILIIH
jgi:flagellar hook assembly protein FlgD